MPLEIDTSCLVSYAFTADVIYLYLFPAYSIPITGIPERRAINGKQYHDQQKEHDLKVFAVPERGIIMYYPHVQRRFNLYVSLSLDCLLLRQRNNDFSSPYSAHCR